MTITEQGIEFFKGAKGIQEEWQPKFGDWVIVGPHSEVGIIVGYSFSAMGEKTYVVQFESPQTEHFLDSELVFVPRQGQLQEMLEERGWKWEGGSRKNKDGYEMTAWRVYEGGRCKAITRLGPTPSIALGKCLLEVTREERRVSTEDIDWLDGEDYGAK